MAAIYIQETQGLQILLRDMQHHVALLSHASTYAGVDMHVLLLFNVALVDMDSCRIALACGTPSQGAWTESLLT